MTFAREWLLRSWLLAVCLLAASLPVLADEPAPPEQQVAARVERMLQALDAPVYETREQAAQDLEQLVAQPELGPLLVKRFQRALVAEETSFEVRARLEPLLRKLPALPSTDTPAEAADIAALLDQLKSDRHVERDSAIRRLQALLEHKELIQPVWIAAKQRRNDPQASASERRLLEPLVDRAHQAWLRSDLSGAGLPKPSPEQVNTWIEEAAVIDAAEDVDVLARKPAERELLDLIARDDTREEILKQLSQRIETETDSAIADKLSSLVEFAKPGMAAEAWSNHTNTTVQYLLIDVPQFNDTVAPPRATHFDRIDDETAHCVTGNSLTEGDYPVRVGIPHPEPGREAMFYLTNLPTPRSRLAYEYSLKRDDHTRLIEITERTLDYFLKRQTPLSEVEILMLAQLEPRTVSRFVGKYFAAVPDAPLESTPNGLTSAPTVYSGICMMLSRIGTHEAVEALEKLARDGTLGKPKYPMRVDIPWVAQLAIANRDPWPKVDEWLAGLVDETLPLSTDPEASPELGASAAGLLLDRHGVSLRPFGLVPAGEALGEVFQFYGFRFSAERDRDDVKRWWQKQQRLAEAARSSR